MANIGKYAIGIRLLLLKQFIQAHAGVNRYVTRGEMEQYLANKGYPVEKKTLYNDLAVLDSEFNMKLEYNVVKFAKVVSDFRNADIINSSVPEPLLKWFSHKLSCLRMV